MFFAQKFLFSIFLAACFTFIASAQAIDIGKQAALISEFDVNGLKVLVKKRATSPTVAVGLFLRGGTRNLTAETAGVEGFMLEAATEASAKFPRAALRRELARTGAQIGAGTSYDYSSVSLAAPRAAFDRAWAVFGDVVLNPSFAAEDVERVRERLLTGLREKNTDPDSFLTDLSEKNAYAGQPYINNPIGTIETVARFKTEDLRRAHRDAMQTSRLLLVVVGNVSPEELKTKIADTFGKLPRGNYAEKPFTSLTFAAPTVEITNRSLPTNYVQGVFSAPSPAESDYYPLQVATSILRDRIFEEVRVKRNLSYAPHAFLNSRGANTGGIYVSAVDANQAINVMLDEVEGLQKEPVRETEIAGVVGQYLTQYYIGQESNIAQAGDLASYELIGGGWRNSLQFWDKVRAVTPSDVQRVARRYIRNMRFVVLGNQPEINRQIFTRQSVQPLDITPSK